jgi:Fe-S cluster biogenesis protein NfuA
MLSYKEKRFLNANNKQGEGGEDGMRENVEKALDKIRPALRADGGDIELVDVVDGVVKVRLTGACGGCPMSQMTLKMGVEKVLKQQVPEVKSVETV